MGMEVTTNNSNLFLHMNDRAKVRNIQAITDNCPAMVNLGVKRYYLGFDPENTGSMAQAARLHPDKFKTAFFHPNGKLTNEQAVAWAPLLFHCSQNYVVSMLAPNLQPVNPGAMCYSTAKTNTKSPARAHTR